MFLYTLRKISSRRSLGPSRTFTELQSIRAILILGERGVLGRTLLSRLLKTGSGAVRTLISDLEEYKIIVVKKTGCKLTEEGLNIYKSFIEKIPIISQVNAGLLSIASFDAVVLVKDVSNLIHFGIEQRDAAIRVGAKGATTLIYENNKFVIPMGSKDCAKDFPSDVWSMLETMLKPTYGDVIIISSADVEEVAIYGAMASALTLIDNI